MSLSALYADKVPLLMFYFTCSTLVYFGLCFAYCPGNHIGVLSCRIRVDEADTPLATVIKEELQLLESFSTTKLEYTSSFRRVSNTLVFVYEHDSYLECSSVDFDYFCSALPEENVKQTLFEPTACPDLQSHSYLQPFFADNRSLHCEWSKLSNLPPELIQVKAVLNSIFEKNEIPQTIPDLLFTGGYPVKTKGSLFNEDTWTTRLFQGLCLNEGKGVHVSSSQWSWKF